MVWAAADGSSFEVSPRFVGQQEAAMGFTMVIYSAVSRPSPLAICTASCPWHS